jgi:N-methylhydantoinase A/oxoprolinase/acetone carboxylase beta subunit
MKKNKKSLVRQFSNDDPSTYLSNEDQKKAMLQEDIKAKRIEEARKNKILVEPIDIPKVKTTTYLNLLHGRQGGGMISMPPSTLNTNKEKPDGLSRRFTQRKLQEGKILEQVDKELANEKMNNERMKDE